VFAHINLIKSFRLSMSHFISTIIIHHTVLRRMFHKIPIIDRWLYLQWTFFNSCIRIALKGQLDDRLLRIFLFFRSLVPSHSSVPIQDNLKMGSISQDYSPSSYGHGQCGVDTSETKSGHILESISGNGGGQLRNRKKKEIITLQYTKLSKN
jgi:hypothetical protein